MMDFNLIEQKILEADTLKIYGRVQEITGLLIKVAGINPVIGESFRIITEHGFISAEVVGFRDGKSLLMAMDEMADIRPGARVFSEGKRSSVKVSEDLIGRIINARLFTCGKGQRIGIMAGSGVGKSVLLGMIARYREAPVTVIALIGERAREVKDFIRGYDVLLLMDSLTRVPRRREIGIATGEPPASKGYTPSVFALLSKLLERAGNFEKGSITGVYTVLVEGDDLTDPVADSARAILDGHIVLSKELAMEGLYPAIDVLQSISRLMPDLAQGLHREYAMKFIDT